jgi:hypothetical protein
MTTCVKIRRKSTDKDPNDMQGQSQTIEIQREGSETIIQESLNITIIGDEHRKHYRNRRKR